MIEIKNVSKSYNKGTHVVNNLSLKINNGEIFGFIGLNGAGKTTTLKMITGILNIDSGEILIDGKNIYTNPVEAKKQFGYVSDNPDIFLKFKGIEYLNFIADIYGVEQDDREKRISEFSDIFEMNKVLENKIEDYSHGMRQKIQIIGSLVHNPQNWILDEPITGLDPKASYDLKKIMKEYAAKGKTVLFSTHILEIAEKLCDRIGIINKGKIIFVGTVEEMREKFNNQASLEEIFIEVTDNGK
jgi:ABC-2 type transport system ATP-binding protein